MRASIFHHIFPLLLITLVLGSAVSLAQSNEILLETHRPEQNPISPVWAGKVKTTAALGVFADRPCMVFRDRPESVLRFDLIPIFDPSASNQYALRIFGFSFGSEAEELSFCNLHSPCDFFPTDAQLLESRTIEDLTKLLGPCPSSDLKWGDVSLNLDHERRRKIRSFEEWSFFRFKESNALETLSVYFFTTRSNGQAEAYVEGLQIRHGSAKPVK